MNRPHTPDLLHTIRACTQCQTTLPLPPKPILQFAPAARIAIVGQAPGIRAHQSNKPWNDPSGERLREWLNVSSDVFYNPEQFAIVPMGFCYPGTGKSGDLPPRPECFTTWHNTVFETLPNIQLLLAIGQYAQTAYCPAEIKQKTLTATVRAFLTAHDNPESNPPAATRPMVFPLPHPSPRNNRWLKNNPWFLERVIPLLRTHTLNSLNS